MSCSVQQTRQRRKEYTIGDRRTNTKKFLIPAWMEREKNALKGTVTRLPAREDIDVPVEEHLIVELYSK